MKAGVAFIFVVLLIGCQYNDMYPATDLPVREIQTDFSTNVQIGIKTYTYDGRNLTRELFEANPERAQSFEVVYEYDAHGNLIRQSDRYLPNEVFGHVFEWSYRDGLKTSQRQYYQDRPSDEQRFFYTGTRLDSIQQFNYNDATQKFDFYTNTTRYSYNDAGQLVQKADYLKTIYTYDDQGHLLTECQQWVDDLVCPAIYEYDDLGRKVKWKSKLWQGEANEEEYFYEGNRLAEKRVWDYPMYGDINRPAITSVKYEY